MWLADGLAPGKESSCCRGSDQWSRTFVQEEGSDSNFHRKVVFLNQRKQKVWTEMPLFKMSWMKRYNLATMQICQRLSVKKMTKNTAYKAQMKT